MLNEVDERFVLDGRTVARVGAPSDHGIDVDGLGVGKQPMEHRPWLS